MTTKLAIIHTSPFTLEPLKALARSHFPGADIVNLLDDSILPELARNGGRIEAVAPRWTVYAQVAEQQGAQLIINACSSVGEVADLAGRDVGIPIFRIDEAMAEYAVQAATTIGVAATLETTLQPTVRLIERKAEQAGRTVAIIPRLADQAYRRLLAGDAGGHDAELRAVLGELSGQADLVVLAQASMARVVASLPPDRRERFVTSPETGMAWIKASVERSASAGQSANLGKG